jgi:hypothetical protein
MCRCPIFQHVHPIHCAICFQISPHLEESWNFECGTPSKKHKIEIVIVFRKQYKGYRQWNQYDIGRIVCSWQHGWYECEMARLKITYKWPTERLLSHRFAIPTTYSSNPIFGHELHEEKKFLERKAPLLNVIW